MGNREQAMNALARAKRVRIVRAEFKRRIWKTGGSVEDNIRTAQADPILQGMKLRDVMMATRRIGGRTADRRMSREGLYPDTKVQDVSTSQARRLSSS